MIETFEEYFPYADVEVMTGSEIEQLRDRKLDNDYYNKFKFINKELEPEMERNQKRWGMTYKTWEDNVEKLRSYTKLRRDYITKQAKSFFNLSNKDMKEYFGD